MTATLDAPAEVPLEPDGPTDPAPPRARRPRPLLIAGAASLSAGFVHAAAIGAHAEHPQAARAFVGVAMLQFVWGAYVLVRPSRALAWIGVALNTALVGAWIVAKTKGLWFVSGLDVKEPVQFADGLAAALAFVSLVAALIVAVRGRRGAARPLLTYGVVIALVALALPGMVEAGNHVHSHGSTVVVGADGKAKVVAEGPTQVRAYDPTKPIDLSGTPGVTPEQQARAEMLVAATLYKLPQWADANYALSKGFYPIGDALTGDEHLVNWNYINDDHILDPDYPEALVYNTRGGGRVLESAMYMLPQGSTLDSVPDIGGALTQWHIHDNLCFTDDPVSPHVAGLTDSNGDCKAPLVKLEPVPMIHVWITPNPCGPFAALTGVGAGQVKAGEVRLCDSAHGTGL